MKDIPVFSTNNGVATIALQQIPYTGFAHITVHSSMDLHAFLKECVEFCRAVGAARILACGHSQLVKFPVFTRILHMQMPVPENTFHAYLFPVTETSLDHWLNIYNTAMASVSNAVILSRQMGKEILKKGTAYYVHDGSEVLGIGIVDDDTVQAIVSCRKGAGECVMKTLCGAVCGDTVRVEVAENNMSAMKLYERMGFVATNISKTWYDLTNIFDMSSKNT